MWIIRVWIPFAIATTLLCGLLYAVVQQNYRQSLNDPQIQMAEDTAARLLAGAAPLALVARQPVDIAASLAPWIVIYDAHGAVLASDALFDQSVPQVPPGLFDRTKWSAWKTYQGNETRVTWQPRVGVREAIVVVQAGNRFVVAGRNMREVENRIWHAELIIGAGSVAILIATLIAVWLGSYAYDFITIAHTEV